MNKHNPTVFALTLLAAHSAVAAPQITSVEGSLERGATLVIHGSGFGAKDPALPRLWDNFEGNAVGDPIGDAVVGHYTRTGPTRYSDTAPYAGDRCAHSELIGGETTGSPGLVSNWIPTEATDAFAAMKFRFVSAAGSAEPHNIKLIRINTSDPDPTHGLPNYNIGNDRGYTSFSGIINHGAMGQTYFGGFGDIPNHEGWNSIHIYGHVGDEDVANGFAGRSINGDYLKRTEVVTRLLGDRAGYRSAFFFGYCSTEGYDVDIYLDDLYADTTLARVMIHSDSGSYEMQLPTAWSDDRIEIACNPGRYVSGEEVNLVVYDAEDSASPPFAITVGGPVGDAGVARDVLGVADGGAADMGSAADIVASPDIATGSDIALTDSRTRDAGPTTPRPGCSCASEAPAPYQLSLLVLAGAAHRRRRR